MHDGRALTLRESKRERQSAMRELVARQPVSSQQELVELLAARGIRVTQATVSRDIAELGLAKVARADRHVYASPEDLALVATASDVPLRRLLADLPLVVRRSGLTLLLITSPGMASALSQAIDSSGLAVLIEAMQTVEGHGGKFALAGLQETVRPIFEIARLDQVFRIFPDVDSALAS